jgi:hypothetical protein
MRYWTYQEIKQKVNRDLDLEDEDFIQPEELQDYVNEAIDECESEIHTLYEDYFLARAPITLVNGQEDYDVPADIYANKIRRLMYVNGSDVYPIKMIPHSKRIERYHEVAITGQSSRYEYFMDNSTAGEPKVILVPTPKEDGQFVTAWYLRNANRLIADEDICDIPEFVHFVIQFVKVRCYEKEGHPNLQLAIQMLQHQREQMTSTLTNLSADGDTLIEADMTHYNDHV